MRTMCLALAMLSCLGMADPLSAQETSLIAFDLEDQFGDRHAAADYAGRVTVVIGSDQGGSGFNGLWHAALAAELQSDERSDQVAFVPLADLRAVPFFLKRMIRAGFSDDPAQWVLMDWTGVFPTAYGFRSDACNMVVFAPDGSFLHHAFGTQVQADVLQAVVAAIRSGLDASQ